VKQHNTTYDPHEPVAPAGIVVSSKESPRTLNAPDKTSGTGFSVLRSESYVCTSTEPRQCGPLYPCSARNARTVDQSNSTRVRTQDARLHLILASRASQPCSSTQTVCRRVGPRRAQGTFRSRDRIAFAPGSARNRRPFSWRGSRRRSLVVARWELL
jgi:hypothetical protein